MRLALLLVSVSVGCDAQEKRAEYRDADKTPAGYHVIYHDAGLLGSGLMTYEQILAAFDAAMVRAAIDLEARYSLPREQVWAMPHDQRVIFKLVDHFHFHVGGIQATGQWDDPYIAVAIHPKQYVEPGVAVPAEALPWTHVIGQTTGRTYYGVIDLINFAPALAHEIGHVFYGAGFEHN